jgi:penicillin-binding protein 1A
MKEAFSMKLFHKFLIGLFIAGVLAVMALSVYVFMVIQDAPTLTKNQLSSDNSTKVYAADGELVWNSSDVTRDYVESKDIPKQYKEAVVSVENKNFYKEHGFSIRGTIAAAFSNLFGNGGLRGGSTITQQLVKLSVFSTKAEDQTIKRKIQELWLSLQVDASFSKDQILEYYINKVYQGHNVFGAQTIAHYYYDKDLKDLNLSQLATIAGLGQSPSVYDLYSRPDLVEKRRNVVLKAMLDNKKIDEKTYEATRKVDIKAGLQPENSQENENETRTRMYGSYVKQVLAQVTSLGYDYTKVGLEIHTPLQRDAQQIVYDRLNNSTAFPNTEMQVGATVVDPATGNVVSQLGGRHDANLDGFDYANNGNRSTGSGIKPLLDYAPAIEYLNWPTNHTIADAPYTYAGTTIPVLNWDSLYQGNITIKKALEGSRNTTALRALDAVGTQRAQSFMEKIGFDTEITGGSQAIGLEASTLQMAAAYAAFANGGVYHQPNYVTSIVTPDNVEHPVETQSERAMRQSTAFLMTSMLKGVISDEGTAPEAEVAGLHQAGKSGLVGYAAEEGMPERAIKDAWMNGYTKQYAISIWTGYGVPQKDYLTWEEQSIPAIVYSEVMGELMANQPNEDWQKPDTVKDLGDGFYEATDGGDVVESIRPAMAPAIDGVEAITRQWQAQNESEQDNATRDANVAGNGGDE